MTDSTDMQDIWSLFDRLHIVIRHRWITLNRAEITVCRAAGRPEPPPDKRFLPRMELGWLDNYGQPAWNRSKNPVLTRV